MPLRTESLDEAQLNLTPMIDIVFLLIIFFMVGTRFSEIEQQFDVELPQAEAVQPMTSPPDALVVNVAQNGEIAIDGTRLSLAALHVRLSEARTNFPDQAVLIRGDGEGVYQSIIDVMDACHRAQIRKFSLAFQPVTPGVSP